MRPFLPAWAASAGPRPPDAATALADLLLAHDRAAGRGPPLLTEAGVAHIRRLLAAWALAPGAGLPRRPGCSVAMPHWDAGDRRLWQGDSVLKTYRKPAPCQVLLLAAFEEEGWAGGHIDDPLPPRPGDVDGDRRERLYNTVHSLNRGLPPGTIHFSVDGTGEGVRWEACPHRPEAG